MTSPHGRSRVRRYLPRCLDDPRGVRNADKVSQGEELPVHSRTYLELPRICAFVGPNNSGKTNLLEAIRRVLAPEWGPRATHFSEEDVYLRDSDRDIEIECSFEPALTYKKLKDSESAAIETLRFGYNRYKRGDQAGHRKLDQECLDNNGKTPSIKTSYGKNGEAPKFEPIISIPQEVRDAIPLIHIGTNRSLREQLPSARNSLLRRIFEGINDRLHNPSEIVRWKNRDGVEVEERRVEVFRRLISKAMSLLKTEEFKQLEASIKRNALEQLGLDPTSDEIDLFFTPLDTMDFYKSLDLVVGENGFTISATEVGEGVQNAIVLSVLRAFEEIHRRGRHSTDRRTRNVPASPDAEVALPDTQENRRD
jgi:putative ATP-dependent endonuclease of OLD family